MNFFDTADIYSNGLSEEILGKEVGKRRHGLLISTKATFPMGGGPNDVGSSRHHLYPHARPAFAVLELTTSMSTTCTASTRLLLSKKRCIL